MSDFYPVAMHQMLKVWATCVCPICGCELESVGDEIEEDDQEPLHLDTFACEYCSLLVTYVSPAKYEEYHLVPDHEKRYLIERQFPARPPKIDTSDQDFNDIPF